MKLYEPPPERRARILIVDLDAAGKPKPGSRTMTIHGTDTQTLYALIEEAIDNASRIAPKPSGDRGAL